MQNEPTETTNQAVSMRSALLDIAAAANDALYTSHPTAESAEQAYAETIDKIKRILFPGTYFTPTAFTAALPATAPAPLEKPVKSYVKLPMLWGGRIDMTLADGKTVHTLGAWCRTSDGMEEFEVWKDGKRVAFGCLHIGHTTARFMVKAMLHQLMVRSGKRSRLHRNRRMRESAAGLLPSPVNPPLAIPPRPGLPEDDE